MFPPVLQWLPVQRSAEPQSGIQRLLPPWLRSSASASQVFPNYPYYPYATGSGNFPSTIDNISDGAHARYDGLLIRAETKSARHGLYALVSYTWSRTFDSGMADGDGTTPGAQFFPLPGTSRADWALSQLNLNDQFTASVLYELPFGKGKQWGGGLERCRGRRARRLAD